MTFEPGEVLDLPRLFSCSTGRETALPVVESSRPAATGFKEGCLVFKSSAKPRRCGPTVALVSYCNREAVCGRLLAAGDGVEEVLPFHTKSQPHHLAPTNVRKLLEAFPDTLRINRLQPQQVNATGDTRHCQVILTGCGPQFQALTTMMGF